MDQDTNDRIRAEVRAAYGAAACGDRRATGCCGAGAGATLGYSEQDLAELPEGADLGLGCGNPQAIAGLRAGETVVDLGSGAGVDCFLAAGRVGPTGRVIGVDMTPAMVTKARENARRVHADNVDFRLGEIESLPVPDGIADVIISNCVINLSPDKGAVFREASRALKPGGRLAICDVVAVEDIPASFMEQTSADASCVTGAARADVLRALLAEAGFDRVTVDVQPNSRDIIRQCTPGAEDFLASVRIQAWKPSVPICCGPSCCS